MITDPAFLDGLAVGSTQLVPWVVSSLGVAVLVVFVLLR